MTSSNFLFKELLLLFLDWKEYYENTRLSLSMALGKTSKFTRAFFIFSALASEHVIFLEFSLSAEPEI